MSRTAATPKAELAMLDQILAGAERAFLASGYDLATMDSVARHAGVARASVYNNFKNKEALFLAVMRRGVDDFVVRALDGDNPALPPGERLRVAAATFLSAAIEPDAVDMYRTVVAQATRFPELSRTLHVEGLQRIERALGILASDTGIKGPAAFAERLLAVLMGGYFGPRLLGINTTESPAAYVDRMLVPLLRSQAG